MTSLSVRCYQLNPSEFTHLFSPQLTYLISLFHEHGYSVRVIGGAVRDILLGETPHDIDLATIATTDDITKIIEGDSNIELVYTRAEQFGTLTLVVGTTVRVSLLTFKQSIKPLSALIQRRQHFN
jgi:tRNA nucleotidyltransferase/poly(A) polymerase